MFVRLLHRRNTNLIGKIWLKSGEVLGFNWYPEFFAARAFYSKRGELSRSIFARW